MSSASGPTIFGWWLLEVLRIPFHALFQLQQFSSVSSSPVVRPDLAIFKGLGDKVLTKVAQIFGDILYYFQNIILSSLCYD